MRRAKLNALLGSCPKSLRSFKSGAKHYINFAADFLGTRGRELPPTVDGLLAWSTLFRSHKTLSNYLGHVGLACELIGAPSDAVSHPSIGRANVAVEKKLMFTPRPKM